MESLRARLREEKLDGYIITGTDPHQSEYVAPRWRTREFISGFTGSSGIVIITLTEAYLWTDSRYFIQASLELPSCYTLMRSGTEGTPDPWTWLYEYATEGMRFGVDSSTISIAHFSELSSSLKEKKAELVASDDFLSPIWKNRSDVPMTPCEEMEEEYAGKSAHEKLESIRNVLRKRNLRWTFISSLDDIAWITNLRADDIACTPVFVSYLFISLTKAVLFVDERRFDKDLLRIVRKDFSIKPYESAAESLSSLAKGPGYFNPDRVPEIFSSALSGKRNEKGADISVLMKSCKNEKELEGMRLAHIYDASAYVSFLSRLDRSQIYDEITISERLENERKKIPGYLGPSFSAIAGFRENGAMCHYKAERGSEKKIDGHGLLVLDTGSQFRFGTTDITRTLFFGADEPTEEEKRDYTLVLKGHLALLSLRFPKGTKGFHIDAIAKQYLWKYGENFFHGTGHGVGCRLSVHEGPQRISPAVIDVPLMPGMVLSDEPGLYKENRYGIRIENLLAVKEDMKTEFGTFYSFETLTLVPYEKKLIEMELLTEEEVRIIDDYHKHVYEVLHELVDSDVLPWLQDATSPLHVNRIYS